MQDAAVRQLWTEKKGNEKTKTLIQSPFNTFHRTERLWSTDVQPWTDPAFFTACSFPHSHLIRAGGDLRWGTNETHCKSSARCSTTQVFVWFHSEDLVTSV